MRTGPRQFAVAALALVLLGANTASVSGPPVEIDALVPSTGFGAFLGASYLKSFRALENYVNQTGGIRGRPLKIVTYDSQTSAQVGLQLANSFIAKKAPIFIDGGPSAVCNSSLAIVQQAGPVDYCLSPLIKTVPNGYVFSASVSGPVITNVGVRYFRLRGFKRLAMISSTDSSGLDFEAKTLDSLALPENKGVELVAREHFAPTDVSVSAQITRIMAAKPDAIFVWTAGTACGTVFRNLSDAGVDLPVQTSSANLVYDQLESYERFVPKHVYFTTLLAMTPEDTPRGPLRDAQLAFASALAAVGTRPDVATNLPWDPTMILVTALRKLGPDPSAQQVRDYIETLHGWVGVNGVYDFGDGSQRGIGENAAQMVEWNPAKRQWIRASKPRGYLL